MRPLVGRAALALGLAATAALPVAGSVAQAQAGNAQAEGAAADASGQLNIPANVQIFGKSDPNVRRATAIVNGEILTGTDIDQRLALIVNANGGKVSAEEQERLRLGGAAQPDRRDVADPGSQVGRGGCGR
jgi:peptidyl-prolyl cis-trans isomerase SurA